MMHRIFTRHIPSLSLIALLLGGAVAGCDEASSASGEATLAEATQAAFRRGAVMDDAEAEAGDDADVAQLKVIFLGDSLTAGLGLPQGEAFPAVLQRELHAAGYEQVQCINAGVSGDTTAGGLARIGWLLKQQPDIIVVGLGANDAMRGQRLAETESNLRGIVEAIREAGIQPLLLDMHVPSNMGADYAESFHAIYGNLADELEVPMVAQFLEGVGGVREMNQADGIHPTRQGHEVLATNVQSALVDLIAVRVADAH